MRLGGFLSGCYRWWLCLRGCCVGAGDADDADDVDDDHVDMTMT